MCKIKRIFMLTAIAVLLLSAVGGGMVGAFLTNSYPNEAICYECQEKAQYQEEVRYDRSIIDRENKESQQKSFDEVESPDFNQNSYQNDY